MKTGLLSFLIIFSAFAMTGLADPAAATDQAIDAAIANEGRTDAHRERDARSHPTVTLGLMDLETGQTVIDIFGGGGYYAELWRAQQKQRE